MDNKNIKEILEYFKKSNKNKLGFEQDKLISYEEAQILLDYITNLQEDNKRLKELCDKYEEEHSTAFNLWTMKMKEMPDYEEKMNYKSRCEKAIEVLERHTRYSTGELLSILQGENNDI